MDILAKLAVAHPRGPPTVVFDLDGCLVHSSPDIAAALNATLAAHGVTFGIAEVERMVGDGLGALLDKAIAARGLGLSTAEREAGFADFRARYAAEPAARSEPRRFVAEAARELGRAGARIAIATNKLEPIAVRMMDQLGLLPLVHAVVGHVPGRARKPAAGPVMLAIARAGGVPARAVMVGDTAADLGAGRSAGMPVVLVTGGYGADDVTALGADFIAGERDELLSAILAALDGQAGDLP